MCGGNDPRGVDPVGEGLVAKCCELRPGFGHLRRLFPQSTTEVLSQHWRKHLRDYPASPDADMSHPSAIYRDSLDRMLTVEVDVTQEEIALIRDLYKKHYPALLAADVDMQTMGRRFRTLSTRVVGGRRNHHSICTVIG